MTTQKKEEHFFSAFLIDYIFVYLLKLYILDLNKIGSEWAVIFTKDRKKCDLEGEYHLYEEYIYSTK